MSDKDDPAAVDDGIREFVIPLETSLGKTFTISGKIRTKLDPATREAIVSLLADALVADFQRDLARKASEDDRTRPSKNPPVAG
jgi:hypothetical protein